MLPAIAQLYLQDGKGRYAETIQGRKQSQIYLQATVCLTRPFDLSFDILLFASFEDPIVSMPPIRTSPRSRDSFLPPVPKCPPPIPSTIQRFAASPPPSPLPVLIIGAGIAGLAFAQALRKHDITFRIFERERRINDSPAGYRIRIPKEGTRVLKSCLSPDLYARLEACSAMNVAGNGIWLPWQLDALTGEPIPQTVLGRAHSSGEFPWLMGGNEDEEPLNVDRYTLRRVLMQGLESRVEFKKDFERYDLTTNGFRSWKKRSSRWGKRTRGVKAFFRDGSQVHGCMLVGADGMHSQLRKLLFPDFQYFTHRQERIYGQTPITKELEEKLNAKCLQGPTVVVERNPSVPWSFRLEVEPVRFKDNEFRRNLPRDYVSWVLLIAHEPSEEVEDSSPTAGSQSDDINVLVRVMTNKWHHSFQALFELADEEQTTCVPADLSPPRIPGPSHMAAMTKVTMIGDAALILPAPLCWPIFDLSTTNALHNAGKLSALIAKVKRVTETKIYSVERALWAESRFLGTRRQMANSPRRWHSFESLFAEFARFQKVAVYRYEDANKLWTEGLDQQWGYSRP